MPSSPSAPGTASAASSIAPMEANMARRTGV